MSAYIPPIHKYALRLMLSDKLGHFTCYKLLKAFGHIGAIFQALENNPDQLLPYLSQQKIIALKQTETLLLEYLPKHESYLNAHASHQFITWDDSLYPAKLRQAPDAPCALYVKGRIEKLNQPTIGIVGSRKASPYGLKVASQFAQQLAQNYVIVSGLADGIDGAAHHASLNEPYSTVAIMGTGIDVIYPSKHKQLAEEISKQGCLVSEFLLSQQPIAYHFPRRNRTIAALSLGVLVVEANLKSGSLITARLANDLGREVFVIPHALSDNLGAQGCHALIQDGAKLVQNITDITNELLNHTNNNDKADISVNKISKQTNDLLIPITQISTKAESRKKINTTEEIKFSTENIQNTSKETQSHFSTTQQSIINCLIQAQKQALKGLNIEQISQQTQLSIDILQADLLMLELMSYLSKQQQLYVLN